MSFDAESFCNDYSIPWASPGSPDVGQGYIGVQCPFCDDALTHGGFNIEKGFYSCHRCGGHWIVKAIATLTKTNISNAKKILRKYSSGISFARKGDDYKYAKKVVFPPGTGPLTKKAKQYLIGRNFDPYRLAAEWGLLSTGHVGEYKFKILAPIYLRGRLVSYQCRDITGKANNPYLPCPIKESVYNHKFTLYGIDKAIKKQCVVVEGMPIVWRLGPGAVATFGIKFTIKQAMLLAKTFDDIFILYDAEKQAQEQADKLYHQIIAQGKNAEVFSLPDGDDLDDLSDSETTALMSDLQLL